MKSKLSGSMIGGIIVATIVSVLVAHYEDFLPYRWQTYAAPDGTFSIELPDHPSTEAIQAPLEGDGTTTLHIIIAKPDRNTAYSCSYFERKNVSENSPDQVLELARDGSLRKVQGALLTQNRITFQGFPGLDMQARARGDSLMDSRLLLVGNRLYMITAVAATERDKEPKTVQRVFGSFRLSQR
jgi:hypothetical protein